MKYFKKIISMLLVVSLLTASCVVLAGAEYEGESRVVLGADLTDEETQQVYSTFGIERGSAKELSVTATEEQTYLQNIVGGSTAGDTEISSVYITLLKEGKGLNVSVSNISWVTKEVYMNALTTVGITDADVVITAPYSVTGTAALAGIFKAYEDITGKELSGEVRSAAAEELVTTSELADTIGGADAAEIVNQLKLILNETVNMTDEELRQEIIDIANRVGTTLTDDQISQLISLVRQLEKLDVSQLTEKVKQVQETIKKLAETGGKVSGFFQKVGDFFKSVGSWLSNLFS